MQTYWYCNKDSTQRLGYSSSANVRALQQGQYTTIGILTQCERTGTATRPVYNDWDTHPVQTYWHCNKDSTQRLGYSSSANVLALQQGQYTAIGILTQRKRTGTATRPVYSDWDTHPAQTYWHCNKASTQRLGYSPSVNVLALQQGQCTDWDTHPVQTYSSSAIGILKRTGTATRTVRLGYSPVLARLGYSSSANVLALQQGQYTTIGILGYSLQQGQYTSANVLALQQGQYPQRYTTIGILIQCKRTGTATRTVYNDWDTHPVRTYRHCNKDSTQRLGYSSSANVLALQQGQYTTIGILTQCERTGTATRTVHNDWDTHPVQTYWHCNKDSIQRLGYSPSVNVLALQQGQYTTIGILTQCKCTCTATRPVHNDWDTHPVQTYWHCNKDSTQRLGYSSSANVLALQQGQYTTWDTHPVRTYWHYNKDSIQRLGYSSSANVLALQQGQYTTIGILTQCKRTGTATRPVYNDWDTHPVRTYWHCNKASTQRLGYSPSAYVLALQQGQYTTIGILIQCERTGTATRPVHNVGYSPSANVLALQQGQYTTIGILTQCERTGTATRTVHNDWDTHPVRTYWHCNKDSTQRLGYSSSANVLALQQGQYTTIGILTQCERTGTATRTVHNDWDTHPVQTYWHCNKDSIQRLGYSSSANVLALQQGQYTTIGILIQCERTGTATRTVHNDWDTHPVQTYWHCNKDSIQRLGYSSSANVLALQQGQYTTIGILIQCERTGTATRPVYNDWDTHPVRTYRHYNKDSIQRLGYSSSANVQALQQGQYTTIGILIQCKRTGTATRTVYNDWDTHPVRTYRHYNKDRIQRLGYSSSANVLALQQGQYTTIGILIQCERTGTATRTVYNDWDTHPVQTYWHCNKDSIQRLGYSSSANVQALQQGQYTTIGILIQCKRTGTATRPVYNDWDTHPVRTYLHCNKASTERLGYSSSANVQALQQGQYTTIGILIQCKRTGTATRTVHNVGYSSSANVLALQQGQYRTIGILIQCKRTGTATRTVYNDWDTHPVQTYRHYNKDSIQ